MSLDYYNPQEKEWVSPRLILGYYDQLLNLFGVNLIKAGDFKKVQEGKVVAISLLGIHKLNGTHFLMQIPIDIKGSPDIVSMNLKEYSDKPVQMELQDVEVVEYGENSNEELADFLINIKLNPLTSKKAYDDKTIIICHITKGKLAVSNSDLHTKIRKINPKATVYLLGPILNKKGYYRLVRVWPIIDSRVEFDVKEEADNYPKPNSLKLSLGTGKKIIFKRTNMPLPSPYKVFELNEQKLKKKFI